MKSKQAGGIVSFIIVAVALAGLLAGGLYLSKNQGRTARDNDTSTPQVATPNQEEQKPQDQQATPKEGEQAAPATPSTPPTNNNQNQQATPQQPAPSTSQPQRDRVANTGPSEELPATGPGETAAVTLAVSILAFTGYRLLQSRRSLRRSALQQ